MKFLLSTFLVCGAGCQALNTTMDRYYNQVEILNMRMRNGDVGIFDELDVWGRNWVLLENRENVVRESVDVLFKYKSQGAMVYDVSDDFLVTVQLHYGNGKLESLSYSYVFENGGSLSAGGAECDF